MFNIDDLQIQCISFVLNMLVITHLLDSDIE